MDNKSKITIENRWLWGHIVLKQECCKECCNGDTVTLTKGKEIKSLIKILEKFNKRGIPKGWKNERIKILKDFEE